MIETYNTDILPLKKFLCAGFLDDYMYDRISTCEHKDIIKYMEYVKMTEILNLTFDKYINEVKVDSDINEFHICNEPHIIYNSNIFNMYMYDTDSLHKLINQDCNIVTKHILSNLHNNCHCMMLIINKNDRTFSIFDSSNNSQIVKGIEKILYKIIQEYNIKYSDNFILLSIDIWNSDNIVINRPYKKSLTNNDGYCVIMSIMLVHYMIVTNKDIVTVIKIFDNFTDNEMTTIINDYSLYYYLFIFS